MNRNKMVVRVTSTEFELNDGRVFEHPIPLEEVPTLEEFQQIYDRWSRVFSEMLENRDRGSVD